MREDLHVEFGLDMRGPFVGELFCETEGVTPERLRHRAERFDLGRLPCDIGGLYHLVAKGVRFEDELAILLPHEVLERRPERRL